MQAKLTSLLVGPTDRSKIFRFGEIDKILYEKYLKDVAEILKKHVGTVNLIPDEGVPLDLAKKFRELNGDVVGYLPKGGCKSLEKNFKYCTSVEEFDSGWSGLNTCLSLKGDMLLALGMSPGTMVEVCYTRYHKKYFNKSLPIVLDKRTISIAMPPEVSEDIDLRYFDSFKQLDKILTEIRRLK